MYQTHLFLNAPSCQSFSKMLRAFTKKNKKKTNDAFKQRTSNPKILKSAETCVVKCNNFFQSRSVVEKNLYYFSPHLHIEDLLPNLKNVSFPAPNLSSDHHLFFSDQKKTAEHQNQKKINRFSLFLSIKNMMRKFENTQVLSPHQARLRVGVNFVTVFLHPGCNQLNFNPG